jgi:hypothetical protein
MSDPIIIKTQARGGEPIVFHIDDDEYKFTPPKLGGLMLAILDDADPIEMTRTMFNGWLLAGMDEADAARIRGRLIDPTDSFDFADINALLEGLIGAVVGRPTRSQSG